MTTNPIESFINSFRQYRVLAEKAIAQVPDEVLHWQQHTDSNSIAIIVNHLYGNMMSRWTDFLTTDGEKEWRQRDDEFEVHDVDRAELLRRLEESWNCMVSVVSTLSIDDLSKTVYIRSEAHSVGEAMDRQLAHYAYHVGQIVYIARLKNESSWTSLSVPKGGSQAFNQQMQSKATK